MARTAVMRRRQRRARDGVGIAAPAAVQARRGGQVGGTAVRRQRHAAGGVDGGGLRPRVHGAGADGAVGAVRQHGGGVALVGAVPPRRVLAVGALGGEGGGLGHLDGAGVVLPRVGGEHGDGRGVGDEGGLAPQVEGVAAVAADGGHGGRARPGAHGVAAVCVCVGMGVGVSVHGGRRRLGAVRGMHAWRLLLAVLGVALVHGDSSAGWLGVGSAIPVAAAAVVGSGGGGELPGWDHGRPGPPPAAVGVRLDGVHADADAVVDAALALHAAESVHACACGCFGWHHGGGGALRLLREFGRRCVCCGRGGGGLLSRAVDAAVSRAMVAVAADIAVSVIAGMIVAVVVVAVVGCRDLCIPSLPHQQHHLCQATHNDRRPME